MPKCQHCHREFEVGEWAQKFCEKMEVPLPKNCPDCRMVRRFLERNPKHLYYRTCDLTHKKTLSQYHSDCPFPVYSPEAWWSDDWNGLEQGREFDFSRPFFEQFLELKNQTPHLALFNTLGTMENSEYNNCTAYLKNCYLVAESDYCEKCEYSNLLKKCSFVADCSVCYDTEWSYECVDCTRGYTLRYSQDCQQCRDSFFLHHCAACSDCIGCINQRQKQYQIFNQQYSREEYEKKKEEFQLHTISGVEKLRARCEIFFSTQPRKYAIVEHNEHSSGDHLFHSKNAYHCFDSVDLEDCAFCAKLSLGVKSSMDYNSWGNGAERVYQCSSCGDNIYNVRFCTTCQTSVHDCDYCAECFSIADCFGCVGLKKQRFCILNKKYSEKEYKKLRTKIIQHMKKTGEWGEFFPIKICPFAYNESMAMDAFPKTRTEVLAEGFSWRDEEKSETTRVDDPLPDSIFDADQSVIKTLHTCACGKSYRIIAQEFEFYKKLQIPVPKSCPSCRHKKRMSKRNPLKLWSRKCSKCGEVVQTSVSPESVEQILCGKCYLQEIY